jgi:hypothetical protein
LLDSTIEDFCSVGMPGGLAIKLGKAVEFLKSI